MSSRTRIHKQINMPHGGTKSLWVSGLTFKTSQPCRQKALCARLRAKHTVGAVGAQRGRWELVPAKDGFRAQTKEKRGKVDDSPGITSQMGTRRVCSKLAKLHSNFPLNTPSQSPIGLSCKRRRREWRETLAGAVHLAHTHLVEATSVSFSTCLHRFTVAKNAALV